MEEKTLERGPKGGGKEELWDEGGPKGGGKEKLWEEEWVSLNILSLT